jgi:hypothetical protein
MAFHPYGVNLALDRVFGNEEPEFFYLACLLNRPNRSSSNAADLEEPDAPSYERLQIPNTAAVWPESVDGTQTNGTTLQTAVSEEPWGFITHWAIVTTEEVGTGFVVLSGRLTSRLVLANRALKFPPGSITIAAR